MLPNAAKRAFDILFAAAMLAFFAPIMLVIVFAIWRTDGAPIFFGHERIGRNGRRFRCLKFRTMVNNAQQVLDDLLAEDPALSRQWSVACKLENDPRILRGIGHFLRKTSLDELPQLFNILRGDMSLVGPRPVTETELLRYGSHRAAYMSVKPGLTGPWQIGGRSDSSYADRVKLDVWYARHAGLYTDLKILTRTTVYFLTGRLDGAR